jgi:hypothetical protein
MRARFTNLTLVLALGASLAACGTAPASQRVASTQSTLVPVETTQNCPIDGGYGRHFGNPTPESENPFLNPCWPN